MAESRKTGLNGLTKIGPRLDRAVRIAVLDPGPHHSRVAPSCGAARIVRVLFQLSFHRQGVAGIVRIFLRHPGAVMPVEFGKDELVPAAIHGWWSYEFTVAADFPGDEFRGSTLPLEGSGDEGRQRGEAVGEIGSQQPSLLLSDFGESVVVVPRAGLGMTDQVKEAHV